MTDAATCGRRSLGWCDGVRHLPVCGCGAVGYETCEGKRTHEREMPRCCTEERIIEHDEPF